MYELQMKLRLIFSALLCGTIGVAAEEPRPRIGVIIPLTGNFANYGTIVRNGIESIQRPGVEWVFEDDACDPSKAVTAYKKLTESDGIPFVIGPACGSPQKAVAPMMRKRSSLALLPSAAPASVFTDSEQRMYSVQYSLDADATFIAGQMNKRGLKRVAIVYVDTDFSRSLEKSFLKAFDGGVVFRLAAPGFDVQYMKSAALKLKHIKFDSLFIPDASPFIMGFRTELKKLGVSVRPTFSVYSTQMSDVLVGERENAEGILYSYPETAAGEDAFGYFPKLAAEILSSEVLVCKGDYECVKNRFATNSAFQSDGTLSGKIILKTIRDGKFLEVSSK